MNKENPSILFQPKITHREEQPYVGIRTRVPLKEMKEVIPQRLDEVFGWLSRQSTAIAGAPLIRYHIINMPGLMDIEIGVPVQSSLQGSLEPGYDHIEAGSLPAGQYASLIYSGVNRGIEANATLLDWGAKNGLVWDRKDVGEGDAFRSRYESYLTDPLVQPDPAKWEIEVAILIAEVPPT